MKTNKLIKFAASLMLCCMFFGCTPEEEKLGTIYGTVTDFSSGEPINNANVRLNPRGETTLTGMDGTFEFVDLHKGSYSLSLSKNGYVDLDDDYVIEIENGKTVQRAIQLQKLHYSIQIVDNDGHTISMLDFGIEEGVVQKTFSIFNNGNMALDFTIAENADWIEEVEPLTGSIIVNDARAVTVRINRDLMSEGENNTNLLITSQNMGGMELLVKATKYVAPVVTTGDVSNVTHNSAACAAVVVSDGGTTVTERGIVFSTAHNPTINDITISGGSGVGSYSCELKDLSPNTTYYAKAYARSLYSIAYGEEVSFTTEILPVFQYGGYTYYVAPDPNSYMVWENAQSYCINLSLYGSGWRLPTIGELQQMYIDRNSIGGFHCTGHYATEVSYWSSTPSSSGQYYRVIFSSGETWGYYNSYDLSCRVRPIRRKN